MKLVAACLLAAAVQVAAQGDTAQVDICTCSDGVSADQATCEAASTGNSWTDGVAGVAGACSDGHSSDQASCEWHTWECEDDGPPECIRDCYFQCAPDQAPPLDAAQCECVGQCDLSACDLSATGTDDELGRPQIEEWIAGGCQGDDSSAATADVYGCTDDTATNYNADATVDDSSCEYATVTADVYGCTDDTATNYNADATVDDNSCEYATVTADIYGCMDTSATNFNPAATVDDGTACDYPETPVTPTPATPPASNSTPTDASGSWSDPDPGSTAEPVDMTGQGPTPTTPTPDPTSPPPPDSTSPPPPTNSTTPTDASGSWSEPDPGTAAVACSFDSDCDQAATEYCDLSTQTCQHLSCTVDSDCVGHPCQGDCLCDSGTSTCRWVYWMGFAPTAEPYDPCGECYNYCDEYYNDFDDHGSCYTDCDSTCNPCLYCQQACWNDPDSPFDDPDLCHDACENTACAPTHAEIQENCPQQVGDCEADSMCTAELGTMFSAWATGARPRPTQSDLFNELAICMFDYELSDNDHECEHEVRNCWSDDDCFQEVESKTPSPGNANVEGIASCFFGQESCDAYACWLDDGCRYLEFEVNEQLDPPWECSGACYADYESSDYVNYDAYEACENGCNHAYEIAYRNATAGVGPEARALHALLGDCRQHMYNTTGSPEREDGDDGVPECMRDCYFACADHEPPLDGTECGCVATCDLSTCSNDPDADGPTRDEIEGWIAEGCDSPGPPECMSDCYSSCTDHDPPLNGTECGCVAACDLSTCSNDPDADGPTRDEIEGWIADGCPGGDDDEPCSFQRLMEVLQGAVHQHDMDALGSHPVYRACAEARRHMGEAVIAGSCDRGP